MNICKECNAKQAKRYVRNFCIICYNRLLKNKNLPKLEKYPRPQYMNALQQEIMEGLMLGDGHLELLGKNPILKVERSLADIEYLKHNFISFNDFCKSGIRYRNKISFGKESKLCNFNTLSCSAFLQTYKRWYIDKKKIVPNDILLTPLTCAIWFCDDGCLFNNRNTIGMQIATHSFSKVEVDFLVQKLSNLFCIGFKSCTLKKKNKVYYVMRAYGIAVQYFVDYIKNVMPYQMMKKLDKILY